MSVLGESGHDLVVEDRPEDGRTLFCKRCKARRRTSLDLPEKCLPPIVPVVESIYLPEASSILAEAARIVDGPRREDYGLPHENHGRTAALWNAYLDTGYRDSGVHSKPLTARDICMLNILQKISRDRHCPKRDNLVDIAGYARNAELCEQPNTGVGGPQRT